MISRTRNGSLALRAALTISIGLALSACSSSGGSTGAGGSTAVPPDSYVFETGAFDVAPGEEKYMCYTATVDQAMAIDQFTYDAVDGVHHLVLVNPYVKEQEGPFECDVLFKQTWLPVFANGTGSADVHTPTGSGFKIGQGQQLLVQLHLLNTTAAPLHGTARLVMHKNSDPNVISAGIYGFGTQVFTLPPQQKTTITNDCAIDKDVQVFAGFPHMHKLGQSMTFWTGPDTNSLTKQFSVDSWSFGEQAIYPMKLDLPKGTMTRLSCAYDNDTAATVGFGEHTSDEMCYFVTFIAPWDTLDGCVQL